MRKVLLATTALAAMGGVTAASADISISGSAEFQYVTTSGTGAATPAAEDRDIKTNTDANISMSSTLDNGMSLSGLISLHETAATGVDDYGWSISGDFGKVAFGGIANDGFGATNTGLTADEGNNLSTQYWSTHNDAIPHSDVSITLPAVSGFTIGLGFTDGTTSAADGSQWGVTYAMDAGSMGITVAYASASDGNNADQSSAGVTVTAGDTKVVVATNKKTASSITHTANSIGASYKVSDALTVQAYTGTTERSNTAAYEVKDTGMGLTYTITPGLSMSITSNDFSGKGGTANESGTRTVVALDATF